MNMQSENSVTEKRKYFWKGNRVSESVFKRRIEQSKLAKLMNSVENCNSLNLKNESTSSKGFKKKIVIPVSEIKVVDSKSTKKVTAQIISAAEEKVKVEGRRIVHIATLANELFCRQCKRVLSLCDIVDEKRYGIASIFFADANLVIY